MREKINKVTIASLIAIMPLALAAFFVLQSANLPKPEIKHLEKNNGNAAKEIPPLTPSPTPSPAENTPPATPAAKQGSGTKLDIAPKSDTLFVGPRENISAGAPTGYGFWSFAAPIAGTISRSGQPLESEFKWLKDHGWKSVVNLRVDNEYGETADDAKLARFNDLYLNYLRLPISDGAAPTDKQADEFLKFAENPANQPVHVHCRGGIGRTSAMVALYRYSVQSWPMDKAIGESRLFQGGVSMAQKNWLEKWASVHKPGSYA